MAADAAKPRPRKRRASGRTVFRPGRAADQFDAIRLFAAAAARAPVPSDRATGRRSLAVAFAVLAVFVCAVVLFWSERERPAREPAAAKARALSPTGRASQPAVPALLLSTLRLMERSFQPGSPRFHAFLSRPATICAALDKAAGGGPAGWQPALVEGNGWECLIGPVPVGAEPDGPEEASTVFLALRSSREDAVAQLGLKSSTRRPEDAAAVRDMARRLLAAAAPFPELSLPDGAAAAFLDGRTVRLTAEGTRAHVSPEPSDPSRVNLLASFALAPLMTLRPFLHTFAWRCTDIPISSTGQVRCAQAPPRGETSAGREEERQSQP